MKTILIITASAEGRSRSWHTSTTAAVRSDVQKSRNRDDAQEWAEAYAAVFPPYQLLIESYLEAQEVVKRNETPSASLLVARDSTAPVARPAPIGKGIE